MSEDYKMATGNEGEDIHMSTLPTLDAHEEDDINEKYMPNEKYDADRVSNDRASSFQQLSDRLILFQC